MLCYVLRFSAAALAGGGPENVFLVVNRKSPASLTIANHYAQLRQIPAGNILTLPWDPKAQTTDVETFRKQILLPALTAIDQRRLRTTSTIWSIRATSPRRSASTRTSPSRPRPKTGLRCSAPSGR